MDAHIEMKFGIQIYRKNIEVKFYFGYDRTIFAWVMALELYVQGGGGKGGISVLQTSLVKNEI